MQHFHQYCLRSVTPDIHCMEIQTTRRGSLGRNGLLFSMTTNIFNFPCPDPFFSPFPQGKQQEDSRSLRPRQPPRTAVQRTALAAHRAPPALAAVQPNSGGNTAEEQHRSAWVQRTVRGHQLFEVKRIDLVAFEKRRRNFSTGKKKKRLIFFWGSHCVCECVYVHTMHG